jgi:hypothetical protein
MRIKEVNVARGCRCFYPKHNQHSVLSTSQCEALSPNCCHSMHTRTHWYIGVLKDSNICFRNQGLVWMPCVIEGTLQTSFFWTCPFTALNQRVSSQCELLCCSFSPRDAWQVGSTDRPTGNAAVTAPLQQPSLSLPASPPQRSAAQHATPHSKMRHAA